MNRKAGLDYFSLDVDFFQDDKIQFVSARFGTKGEAITLRLLCKIYRQGYYTEWDEDIALLFAKGVGDGCRHSCVNDVVHELLKRGFFDKSIFERFSILTSIGIQKRYFEASIRRKGVLYNKDYLLIDLSKYNNVAEFNQNVDISSHNVIFSCGNGVMSSLPKGEYNLSCESDDSASMDPKGEYNLSCVSDMHNPNHDANIINQNVDILEQNADILKQSKVKESKVKEKNIKDKPPISPKGDWERITISQYGFSDNAVEAISDWLAYKKERRQGYKPTGLKSLLTKIQNMLSELGEEVVIYAITESMACNYQGIIWEKAKGKFNVRSTTESVDHFYDYAQEALNESLAGSQ